MRLNLSQSFVASASAALTAVLCASLAFPAELVAEVAATSRASTPKASPLNSEQRVEHALSRFTFGPTPGEVATVQREGLDRWFEQQLHPERIDDAAFEQKLQGFPALQLTQEELLRRFPSPAMLRAGERRGLQAGGRQAQGPVEHAVYADASAAYEARKETKAGQAALAEAAGDASPTMASGAAAMGSTDQNTSAAMSQSKAAARQASRRELASGMRDEDVQEVLALMPEERFARLVAMTPEQMLQFRAALRGGERLRLLAGLTPEQAESVAAMGGAPVRVVGTELLQARLLRDLESQRQLQAVMTDFWLNHFNVYARKNQNEPYLLPAYERETILPHALGRFEDLLVAVAQSPAMLMYLDNWLSIGPDSQAAARVAQIKARNPNGPVAKKLPEGINENYARELMELHTLGVNGGYTQKDVVEVAKCLTGWTIDRPGQGGEFHYQQARHEPGDKVVLGQTIKSGGESEGLTVLHLLATSPATAQFLSQKLAVRFVSDTPPPALVDHMAATYMQTDGDISAVLRTLFHAPEFWSPAVYKAKVKTPLEFVTSAVRGSGAQVDNDLALVGALNKLGMPLYGMQTPNGYPWTAEEWVSSNALVSRMNLALVLSGNRLVGTRMDWNALLGGQSEATPVQEARLETVLLGGAAGARTRAAVLGGANDPTVLRNAEDSFRARAADGSEDQGAARLVRARASGGVYAPESPVDTMAGLLLGSPEFQRR